MVIDLTIQRIAHINRRLAAVNPQYTAEFVPAEDETVDDEISVLNAGKQTCWAIQVGPGYFGVNEYGLDAEGEFESVVSHGLFGTLGPAVDRLCALLPASL